MFQKTKMFAEVISKDVWKDELNKLEKIEAIKINFYPPFTVVFSFLI